MFNEEMPSIKKEIEKLDQAEKDKLEIKIGERLPGLNPDHEGYPQVIESFYGPLVACQYQYRDGSHRLETQDGKIEVIIDIQTGIVEYVGDPVDQEEQRP